jgi:histidinol-phosphate aminotransferase
MAPFVRAQRGLDELDPYTPSMSVERVQREYGPGDVIDLASNQNPQGPSQMALTAAAKALSKINVYPDGLSHDLRRALADFIAGGIGPDQVAVGNGVDGIIMQVCLAYLDEESEAMVSCSSFPVYDIYIKVMRAKLTKIPLKDFRLDLDGMARAVNDHTKLVFVCNPNNPTGTIVTASEVDAFMARVPTNVLVVFDEAYYEMVDAHNFPDTVSYVREGRTNVMVMRTFSKVFGLAGIRLGYAIARPEILLPLRKVKEPFDVNSVAQIAGIAALGDREFVTKSVAMNRSGREYLYGELRRLGLRFVESQTNFILVELGPKAADVHRRLLAKGVIVRPCGAYDLPDFLRVTVGSPVQNVRFVETLGAVI